MYYGIGSVKRVDFAPIGKPPGFGEHEDADFCCAFVHFYYFNNSELTQEIFSVINTPGGCYHFHFCNTNAYWMLIKNHCPIPDSVMNTHQIVENCRILERRLTEQANQIQHLEKICISTQHRMEQQLVKMERWMKKNASLEEKNASLQDRIDDLEIEDDMLYSKNLIMTRDIYALKEKNKSIGRRCRDGKSNFCRSFGVSY